MADKKITDLTAATTLIDADVVTAVTDIATTAANKKITVANLKTSLHAAPGAIGGTTPAAVSGTTITATTGIVPSADNAVDLGSGTAEFKDLYIDGTANIDSLVADTADINGGTVDGAVIGGASAAAITGTTITSTGDLIVGNGTDEKIDWVSGNVTYVPIGASIEAYHDAATAGDTLILASGTYTITDDIDITKAINIVGQGMGKTIIKCDTASKKVFDITSAAARISDLTIDITADTTRAFAVTTTTGFVFENINISIANASMSAPIYTLNSNGTYRNITATGVASVGSAYIFYIDYSAATVAVGQSYILDSDISVSSAAGATTAYPIYIRDNGTDSDQTIYIRNSKFTGLVGNTKNGLDADGGDIIVYAENSIFDGATADVTQANSATINLRDCVLVNNTTSGTITQTGTLYAGGLKTAAIVGTSLDLNGNIDLATQATTVTLKDNQASALIIGAAGCTNAIGVSTTDDAEQVDLLRGLGIKRFHGTITLATDNAETDVGLTPAAVIMSAAIRVSTQIAGLGTALQTHTVSLGINGTAAKYCTATQGAAGEVIDVNKKAKYIFDPTTDTEAAALKLTVEGGDDNIPSAGAVEVEVIYMTSTDLADA